MEIHAEIWPGQRLRKKIVWKAGTVCLLFNRWLTSGKPTRNQAWHSLSNITIEPIRKQLNASCSFYGVGCIAQTEVQLLFLKLKNKIIKKTTITTTKTNFKAVVIANVIIQILRHRGTSIHPIHFVVLMVVSVTY